MGCGGILLLSVFISVAVVNGNIEELGCNAAQSLHLFHISCNDDDKVVRMDLGNAGLSGPLSQGLAQLANLQYLEVQGNNLTGVIPSEFGNLTSLVSLDLFNNQLLGSIPSSLGNLKSLKYLGVNNNALSGDLPTEILELVSWGNTQVLNVSENFMT